MKKYISFLIVVLLFSNCTSHYEKGKKHIEKKEWELAKETLSKIGRDEKIYSSAQKLISIANSNIAWKVGNYYYEKGDYKKAMDRYKKIKYNDILLTYDQSKLQNVEDQIKKTKILLEEQIEKEKIKPELLKNLPGVYEYHTFISLVMELYFITYIYKDSSFLQTETSIDHYTGEITEATLRGSYKPRVTRFTDGEYGLVLEFEGIYNNDAWNSYKNEIYFYNIDERGWVLHWDSGPLNFTSDKKD